MHGRLKKICLICYPGRFSPEQDPETGKSDRAGIQHSGARCLPEHTVKTHTHKKKAFWANSTHLRCHPLVCNQQNECSCPIKSDKRQVQNSVLFCFVKCRNEKKIQVILESCTMLWTAYENFRISRTVLGTWVNSASDSGRWSPNATYT